MMEETGTHAEDVAPLPLEGTRAPTRPDHRARQTGATSAEPDTVHPA